MTDLKTRFHQRIPIVLKEWEQCALKAPIFQAYTLNQQKTNEDTLDSYIEKAQKFLNCYRSIPRRKWKQAGDVLFQDILQSDALCITTFMTPVMKKSLSEVSKQFLRDALAFDEELSLQDIGQAMRNVWICMVLQLIFKQEMNYHQAIFGYSMLYPYSDNVLDDPNLTEIEKATFNERFYQRLRGQKIKPSSIHEEHVFALIACIEQVYDRNHYPDVYESLYLIMEGQIKSLTQQRSFLSRSEISNISVEKGAASVVADGFMVCGNLDDQALSFCMQYGFMLQLGDDLQDMLEDRQNHHHTLFSIPLSKEDNEKQVKQLLVFTQQLLEEYPCDTASKRLIIENCELLVFLSVVLHPQLYSLPFLGDCRTSLPLSDIYMQQKSIQWQQHGGITSLVEDQKKLRGMLKAFLK